MSYWPQQRRQEQEAYYQQLIQVQQEYQHREHQRRCEEQEELKAQLAQLSYEQEVYQQQEKRLIELEHFVSDLVRQGEYKDYRIRKVAVDSNFLRKRNLELVQERAALTKELQDLRSSVSGRTYCEPFQARCESLLEQIESTFKELELTKNKKRQKGKGDRVLAATETRETPIVSGQATPTDTPAAEKPPTDEEEERTAPKEEGDYSHLTDQGFEGVSGKLTGKTKDWFLWEYVKNKKFARALDETDKQKTMKKETEKQSTCVFDGLDLSESTHFEPATTNVAKLSMLAYTAWSSWKTFQPEDTITFAVIVSLSAIMLLSVVCPRRLWKPTNIGKRVRFVHVYTMACCITVLLRTLAWSQSEPATKPAPNQSYTPGTAKLEYEEYIKNLDYDADRALDTDPTLHVVGVTLFLCAMITLEATCLSFTKVSSEIENSDANPSVLRKSAQFLYKCPHKSPHGERTFVSINKSVLLITLFLVFIFYDYPMVTAHATPKPSTDLEILYKIGTSFGFQVLTHDEAEACANWKYHDYFSPTAKSGESGERKKGPSKFDPTTPKRQNMCLAHITRCTTLKGEWSFEELRCTGDPNNKNWKPSHQQDARKQKEDSGLFFKHMSELDQNVTFENHKASCKMSNKWKASMLILIIVVIHLEFYSKKPIDPEEEWAKWATNPITLCCVFIGVTFVAFLTLKGYIIVGIAEVSLQYLAMVGMIIMLCTAPKEWRNTLLVVLPVLLLWFRVDSKFQESIKHLQGLPYSVVSKLAAMLEPKKP